MQKRWISVFGAALVLALGTAYLFARPANHERLQLLSNSESASWPANAAWTWSFPIPAEFEKGSYIGVEVRLKSKSIGKLSPIVRITSRPISHDQADRTFGTGGVGSGTTPPSTGTISVTLLDLADIGVLSDRPGKTLRILSKLSIGGGSTRLSSDAIYLDGNSFAGWSFYDDGHWQNGELPIMKFVVAADERQDDYDVVLVNKPAGSN